MSLRRRKNSRIMYRDPERWRSSSVSTHMPASILSIQTPRTSWLVRVPGFPRPRIRSGFCRILSPRQEVISPLAILPVRVFHSPDIVRAVARLHQLRRTTTRPSATASPASAYTNLPEHTNGNLILYGAGVPDEHHDFDLTQIPQQDNRTDG